MVQRPVRVGVSLHLSDRVCPVETGRARSVADKGTRRGGCLAIPSGRLQPHRAVGARGERPATRETVEERALHGVRRRAGHVDHQRRRALLQRGPCGQRGRDRHRARVGTPRGERVEAGERQQRLPAVAAGEQDGGHVAGLVVRQAGLVDLDLAEHRHHGHEQARALQRREHLQAAARIDRRTPPGPPSGRRARSRRRPRNRGPGPSGRATGDSGSWGMARILPRGPRETFHRTAYPGGVNDVSWGALALSLTVLGGIYTWWALRHRGMTAAVRAAGITLLPIAAWMTGLLSVFGDIVDTLLELVRPPGLQPEGLARDDHLRGRLRADRRRERDVTADGPEAGQGREGREGQAQGRPGHLDRPTR